MDAINLTLTEDIQALNCQCFTRKDSTAFSIQVVLRSPDQLSNVSRISWCPNDLKM